MHTTTKPIMVLALIAGATQASTTTTTFSSGTEGWAGPSGPGGSTAIQLFGGNDGQYLQTNFTDFGITFSNSTNQAFIGDYTTAESITLSIDLLVDDISFAGNQTTRPWLVELRDFDSATNGLPWASVFFYFDEISRSNNSDWATYSVTFDPNSSDLPFGWGGYGDEDPNTFEPILPEGVTFSDVLSGIDEIAFTTLQPGFGFLSADHRIGVDNISITRTVPAPSALALIGMSGLVGTRRRR
jgi:hypothetical protein